MSLNGLQFFSYDFTESVCVTIYPLEIRQKTIFISDKDILAKDSKIILCRSRVKSTAIKLTTTKNNFLDDVFPVLAIQSSVYIHKQQ